MVLCSPDGCVGQEVRQFAGIAVVRPWRCAGGMGAASCTDRESERDIKKYSSVGTRKSPFVVLEEDQSRSRMSLRS